MHRDGQRDMPRPDAAEKISMAAVEEMQEARALPRQNPPRLTGDAGIAEGLPHWAGPPVQPGLRRGQMQRFNDEWRCRVLPQGVADHAGIAHHAAVGPVRGLGGQQDDTPAPRRRRQQAGAFAIEAECQPDRPQFTDEFDRNPPRMAQVEFRAHLAKRPASHITQPVPARAHAQGIVIVAHAMRGRGTGQMAARRTGPAPCGTQMPNRGGRFEPDAAAGGQQPLGKFRLRPMRDGRHEVFVKTPDRQGAVPADGQIAGNDILHPGRRVAMERKLQIAP